MAFTLGERDVRPLTADEVMRMVELGILAEDEPVELLHGALTEVASKTPAHEALKMRLQTWLYAGAAHGGYWVRVEAPIVVPDRTSLPEPDIAVVEPGDYTTRHPAGALLVVEVAVSSLRTDTTIKPALYAAARVPELWVVDVARRSLHVFQEPAPGGYTKHDVLTPPWPAQPTAIDVEPLDLDRLFADV